MRSKVSRFTVRVDGAPACIRCNIRPQRWDGKRWQSYCNVCKAADMRQRRAGTTQMQLTPEEVELIRAYRTAPAGRHHAG